MTAGALSAWLCCLHSRGMPLATRQNRLLQNVGGPLVEALARGLRGDKCAAMDFWRHTQEQLARGWFFGVNAFLFAFREIVFDGVLEFRPQLRDGFSMEANDAADTKNASNENVVTLVVLHASRISFE